MRQPVLLTVFLLLAVTTAAWAQLPSEAMHVSGVLRDAQGAPAAGPVQMGFFVYDSLAGGTLLWSELHNGVTLDTAGRYHVTLGSSTPLTPSLFANPDAYFTLEVEADGEMAPRLPLGKVPTAFNADLLDGSPPSTFAPRTDLTDQDPMTSPVDWRDLTAIPAGFVDDTDDVDDADADPTNELNSSVVLMGNSLEISDAGGTLSADLSSLSVAPGGAAGGDLTGTYPNPGLASGSVDTTELATFAVTTSKIAPGAVTSLSIASGAVFSTEIRDETITDADLGPDCVGASEIATGAVGSDEIADESITASDIGANAVGISELDEASVDPRYVNATGDTMTGDLHVDANLYVGSPDPTDRELIVFDQGNEGIAWEDTPLHQFRISDDLALSGAFRAGGNDLPQEGFNVFSDREFISDSGEMSSVDDVFIEDDLEVGGDLFLSNQLFVGDQDGDQFIYFHDEGSPTNEYLAWSSSLARFQLSNELHVAGNIQVGSSGQFRYTANQHYDHFVGPDQFRAYQSGNDWLFDGLSGRTDAGSGPTIVTLLAPLNLPQGAVVTELVVYYYDNTVFDSISLARLDMKRRSFADTLPYTLLTASGVTGGPTASSSVLSASQTGSRAIDNGTYAYHLSLRWEVSDGSNTQLRFYGARVHYTLDKVSSH